MRANHKPKKLKPKSNSFSKKEDKKLTEYLRKHETMSAFKYYRASLQLNGDSEWAKERNEKRMGQNSTIIF